MKGFKDFLMQGNIVSLAIAVIIGTAFGTVVTAFTKIIMDLIGMIFGQPNFDSVAIGQLNIGVFITALVTFLMIAAVVYFIIVKPMTALQSRLAKDAEPEGPSTEELLAEIRDLLASQRTPQAPPVPIVPIAPNL